MPPTNMAELGEHVRLLTGDKGENLPHVERYSSRKSILLTQGNKSVSVYDVTVPRTQKSWNADAGREIQHGAVVDHTNQNFVAIINKQIIYKWTTEEKSIKKGKRVSLSQPAYRLISVSPLPLLIFYADGKVAWLNNPDEIFGKSVVSPSETILWTDAALTGKHLHIVALVTQNGLPNSTIFVYKIPKDSTDIEQREIALAGDGKSLCHCLTVAGSKVVLLSTDRLTGTVSELIIDGPNFGQNHVMNKIPLRKEGTVSVCSIGATHLAVFGALSNDNKVGLGIWDTKFGILHAWKAFPNREMVKDEKVELICIPGHLVVSSSSGMYSFSYKSRQSTLSATLGKLGSSAPNVTNEGAGEELENHLLQLLDQKQISSKKNFTQSLNAFLKAWDGTQHKDVLSVQAHLVALIEKLMTDDDLWSHDSVNALIERSLIPVNVCVDFIRKLISKNDIVLVRSCLSKIDEIPEISLVECLKFYLNTDDDKFAAVIDGKIKEIPMDDASSSCPFQKAKATLIGEVLSLPFNDVFLIGHVKQLDFSKCIQVLQYLHYTLDAMPLNNMERSTRSPSLIEVVDWINILLDAHFTQLIISLESRQILVNLHQTVEKNVQFFDELVGLENILASIKEQFAPPQKKNPGLYNIFVLHIP